MPRSPDQARGFQFERDLAEALGLNLVPGSGNKPHELSDAKGRMRISAKSTIKRSWAETMRQLHEAIDLAQGTGELPGLAVEVPETGDRVLILPLEAAGEFLSYESQVERKPSRADRIRASYKTPALLRDDS